MVRLAVVLGMWLDWRHADAGVGIGMPALVGPSWREGVGKRKTENEYFVKSSASRFPNRRGWIRIKKLALTNRFSKSEDHLEDSFIPIRMKNITFS